LENALLWELKSTYRREFTTALEILEMVGESTGVVLPVDEAGFITMHLVNAELTGNLSASMGTASAVSEIVALVRERLAVPLAIDSVDYARFLTHIKFALQRIEEGRLLTSADSMLYEMVKSSDPTSYDCAVAIAQLVHERYDVQLPDEEMLYLMVHVGRLRARDEEAA
jgi:beta-glucoside operon transcriptional antiterminator